MDRCFRLRQIGFSRLNSSMPTFDVARRNVGTGLLLRQSGSEPKGRGIDARQVSINHGNGFDRYPT